MTTRKPAPRSGKAKRTPASTEAKGRRPAAMKPAAAKTVRTVKPTRRAATAKTPAKARPRRNATKRPGAPRPGPLEASYSATLFRSRAEARWAIFFDLVGWDWDYEPCHYALGSMNYLPDFYLPGTSTWVEVKGPPFLDAAAMGKAASSAAGPHPLPSRQAPYGLAGAYVLVGPIPPAPAGGRPVHQLVKAQATPGLAGMHRAVWELDGTLRAIDPKAWLTIPATGAKTARRPTLARAAEILYPEPVGALGMPPAMARAYVLAAATRFDEKTGALAKDTSGLLVAELACRRRGRPLGCAA